ncbi:MAG: metal-dependent transcriptional regulator, partial [Clostridia bacterium]|nr:metal-dependent transcriptional regulator [Clostridia bacterium]
MKYRESEEMYLETIYLLSKEKSNVHSIDIATELGFSRASVSRAVGLLQKP